MTELDGIFPDLALELIEEFGKVIQYVTIKDGVYDVATARNVTTAIPSEPKAIVEDYSLQGSGQGYASGLIEAGDKKLTVAALAFDPDPTTGDKFGLDGTVYTVQNVKTTYSGEEKAIHEIQGRR